MSILGRGGIDGDLSGRRELLTEMTRFLKIGESGKSEDKKPDEGELPPHKKYSALQKGAGPEGGPNTIDRVDIGGHEPDEVDELSGQNYNFEGKQPPAPYRGEPFGKE